MYHTEPTQLKAFKGPDNSILQHLPDLILATIKSFPKNERFGNTCISYSFTVQHLLLTCDNCPHQKLTGVKGGSSKNRLGFNHTELDNLEHALIHTSFHRILSVF